MRWWLRVVVTLVLTPLVWGLIDAYASGALSAAFAPVAVGLLQFVTSLAHGAFGAVLDLLRGATDVILEALGQIPAVALALLTIYAVGTLLALPLILLVLLPLDVAMRRIGVDLLLVVVAPLLSALILLLVVSTFSLPQPEAVSSYVSLAALYGLVWGLTLREPPRRRRYRADVPSETEPFAS